MIDQQTTETAPEQTQAPTWSPCWERSDYNLPVAYGIDEKTENGTRFYRAWCQVLTEPRLESEVYEACDEADPHYASTGLVYNHTSAFREHETARAAAVRATMREDQASITDMQARAQQLHERGVQIYYTMQRQEEERKKRQEEDNAALKQARLWLRGMVLLMEGGTDDEIKALRYLFGNGKERRF
jgi:hypothetical protein